MRGLVTRKDFVAIWRHFGLKSAARAIFGSHDTFLDVVRKAFSAAMFTRLYTLPRLFFSHPRLAYRYFGPAPLTALLGSAFLVGYGFGYLVSLIPPPPKGTKDHWPQTSYRRIDYR